MQGTGEKEEPVVCYEVTDTAAMVERLMGFLETIVNVHSLTRNMEGYGGGRAPRADTSKWLGG